MLGTHGGHLPNPAVDQAQSLNAEPNFDTQWRFRPPPWGLGTEGFQLCPRVVAGVPCRLGEQCSHAHSKEELNEWQYRSTMRQKAVQNPNETSLMNMLLQQISQATDVSQILKEGDLNYASIQVGPEAQNAIVSRDSLHEWSIIIKSKLGVQWIALIDNSSRSEFHIESITFGSMNEKKNERVPAFCQEWKNQHLAQCYPGRDCEYQVKVSFKSCVFGTFTQCIVFDFGVRPVLAQHLKIEVVPDPSAIDKVEREEALVCKEVRWDSFNADVVSFKPPLQTLSPDDEKLLLRYPPSYSPISPNADILLRPMCPEAYKRRLHVLLNAEEIAQRGMLSKYNIEAELQLVESYWLTGLVTAAKFCIPGELFAQMRLHHRLTEDTAAGRIILNSCTTVLMSTCKDPVYHRGKRKVYEVLIEGKCKDIIYLRLPVNCVKELNLKPEEDLMAEIQFQLDRLQLCELHHAIDSVSDVSLLFPRLDNYPSLSWIPFSRQFEESLDSCLNAKQKEAILWMMAPLDAPLPPVLLMGPYGTGKTYTLAQGIKNLLQHTDARILVCTHSNSAADLYVKDYLHTYVEAGMTEAKPLRIYYQHRRVETVHPIVLQYCLLGSEGSSSVFRKPVAGDLVNRRIVIVTLATSRCLTDLGLPQGFFTHIILDEAAQVMECEAILPFALLGKSTRLILAGDHMQLCPEVHSSLARQHNLHVSLLERLFDMYPQNYPCAVLLCDNYRSHPVIVQFTSKLFYQNQLQATSQAVPHPTMYPLSFFTAKGLEVQDSNSTAYYNNAEAYEVVERIMELKKTWPKCWGPIEENSIGVVTPYADQVFQLRAILRQNKLANVSVERVLNIQGKQFRVIVLSTVRTRHTCLGKEDKYYKANDGSKVDVKGKKQQEQPLPTLFSDEDEQDFGFLSNAKLLITAITRAQSLVMVAGDPIALCSIGKCRKLWEHYLETCSQNNSLNGTTHNKICVELENLEVGVASTLDPKAPAFVPRNFPPDLPPHSVYSMRSPHTMLPFPLIVPVVTASNMFNALHSTNVRSYGRGGGGGSGSPVLPDGMPLQLASENPPNGVQILAHGRSAEEQCKMAEESARERKVEELNRLRRFNGNIGLGPESTPGEMGRSPFVDQQQSDAEMIRKLCAINGAAAGATMPLHPPNALQEQLSHPQQPLPPPPQPNPRHFVPVNFLAGRPCMPVEELERRINLSMRLGAEHDPRALADPYAAAAAAAAAMQQHHHHHHHHRLGESRELMEAHGELMLGHQRRVPMDEALDEAEFEGHYAARHARLQLNPGMEAHSNASQCLLSYAEALRTSAAHSPVSVVADFEQRVAPKASNGLYKYF